MPITIENEFFRLQVSPANGARVSSLVDKADSYELLYGPPLPTNGGPQYDRPFLDNNYAGWVECFPAIAAGPYPGEPYAGIAIPDHGELWSLPTTAVPTQSGITTVWHGLRFGYRFVRKLRLVESSIIAEYTLVNLSPFEFRFVWAMHALMSRVEPVRLRPPTDVQWSRNDPGMADPHLLPSSRTWKRFGTGPIGEPFVIEYPTRQRALSIKYSSENVPAQWGVWIDNGGVAPDANFAIEPTTGRSDDLAGAVNDGSAGRVGAMGTCKWAVTIRSGSINTF